MRDATDRRYARLIEATLNDPELTDEQREALEAFVDIKEAQGVGVKTLGTYMDPLRRLGRFLKKPYEEATRMDIARFIAKMRKEYAPTTVAKIIKSVKHFYKELLGAGREDPECTAWLKRGRSERELDPKDLVTRDELEAMINAAENPMHKALIAVLYESACEAKGVLALKVGDVQENGEYVRLTLRGKRRGQNSIRVIPIVEFASYLRTWLEIHPERDNPDAPLWYTIRREAMSYDGFRTTVRLLAKRAGIKKRMYPHLFRHSRLTELAKHLRESVLRKFAGWTADSRMVGRYVHLAAEDVEEAILALYATYRDSRNLRQQRSQ